MLSAAATTVLGLLSGPGAAHASPVRPADWSGLVNQSNNKCIDIKSEDNPYGARAQVYHCTGSIDQFFEPVPVPGVPGYFTIVAKKTGYCLTAAGSQLQSYPCDGSIDQQYTYRQTAPGWGYLTSRSSGQCVAASDSNDGAAIVQFGCAPNPLQYWSFR
jgi:hypothetical protein